MVKDLDPVVLQRLYELDRHENFELLRSHLKTNEFLTTGKEQGSLIHIAGMKNSPRPFQIPSLVDLNYFGLLGRGLIFKDQSLHQGTSSLRLCQADSCVCPIERGSCSLTSCVKCDSHYSITITKTVSETDWSAFWSIVKQWHDDLRTAQSRPSIKLLLEDYIWHVPLPTVMLNEIRVVSLFVENCAQMESKNWSNLFSQVEILALMDCTQESFDDIISHAIFPNLQFIVMDRSTCQYELVKTNMLLSRFPEGLSLNFDWFDTLTLFERRQSEEASVPYSQTQFRELVMFLGTHVPVSRNHTSLLLDGPSDYSKREKFHNWRRKMLEDKLAPNGSHEVLNHKSAS